MSWKDLPKDRWRPCTICGHMIKKEYLPSSYAGALFAQNKDVGCEYVGALWHQQLVNKRYLLSEMERKQYPQSLIDELKKEITVLETQIPKPLL